MKRLSVIYLKRAQQDLEDIFRYIERDSPEQAARWLLAADKTLARLEAFPKSGALPRDARLVALGYRVVVVGEHLAFYLVRRRRIEIRRVLHGKRLYHFLL